MSVRLKLIIIILFVALVPLTVSALTTLGIHQLAYEQKVTELHRRTAEHEATRLASQLSASTRGLVELVTNTISWSELTAEERDAAVWLVYRQSVDVAAVVLIDEAGDPVAGAAFVEPTHAGEAPEHPAVEPAFVEELRDRLPREPTSAEPVAFGSVLAAPPLEAPVLPIALGVVGTESVRWVVGVALSLRGFCGAVDQASGFDVLVATADFRLLCGGSVAPPLGALPPELAEAITVGHGFGRYRDATGSEFLVATSPIQHGWSVVARQPSALAYGASQRIRARTVFWIVVGLVVALVAGLFLSRAISRPIERLIHGARQLAQGNFRHRLGMTEPDEFGRLGRAFDQMSDEIASRDAEIRAWNEELQDRVTERTVELERAHQRLLKSEKVAALGTFSSGVASEVNDPLTAVLGITQLVLNRSRKDPARARDMQLLEKAEKEALRIRAVIRRIQTLAQSQSQSQFAPVRVNDLLDATLGLLDTEISRRKITVVRAYAEQLPRISGNFMQLQQALLQVLTNAVDAVGEEPEIVLSTLQAEVERVRIVVADNGCGILPSDLPHVMEPFFTTKEAAEGAGLGLAIAQRIIEEHNGTIGVTSNRGAGTVVAIALPALDESSAQTRD